MFDTKIAGNYFDSLSFKMHHKSSLFSTIMLWTVVTSQTLLLQPSHPGIARRICSENSLENTTSLEKTTQQSAAYIKLAAGVAIGLGLPVFAALWALAFVLWGRRKRRKYEETRERDFVSMSEVTLGGTPAVSERYFVSMSEISSRNTPAVPEKDLNWMVVRPLRCYLKTGRER